MYKFKTEFESGIGRIKEYWWDDLTEKITIRYRDFGADKVIADNKKQAIGNKGFAGDSKRMFHYASIPNGVIHSWLQEGIDIFSNDPDMKKKVIRKLEDPEWRYLKVTESKLWRPIGSKT